MKRLRLFAGSWLAIYFIYSILFIFFLVMNLPSDYSGDYKGAFFYWFFINVLGFPLMTLFEHFDIWPYINIDVLWVAFINSLLLTTFLNFLYRKFIIKKKP